MKLIFTRRRGIVSWLIRLFTKSKVSHVIIGGLHFYGQPVVMHATHGGLRIDVLDVWKERTKSQIIEVYEIKPDVSRAIPVLAAKLGSPYDFPNLIGNALSILLKRRVKVRNLFADPKNYVCSELIVFLDPSGLKIPEFRDLDPERTTPEGLRLICKYSDNFHKTTNYL